MPDSALFGKVSDPVSCLVRVIIPLIPFDISDEVL